MHVVLVHEFVAEAPVLHAELVRLHFGAHLLLDVAIDPHPLDALGGFVPQLLVLDLPVVLGPLHGAGRLLVQEGADRQVQLMLVLANLFVLRLPLCLLFLFVAGVALVAAHADDHAEQHRDRRRLGDGREERHLGGADDVLAADRGSTAQAIERVVGGQDVAGCPAR